MDPRDPGWKAPDTSQAAAQAPLAVVDQRLRVRGIEDLRVVDASVMPDLMSGNTMITSHAETVRGRVLAFLIESHPASTPRRTLDISTVKPIENAFADFPAEPFLYGELAQ